MAVASALAVTLDQRGHLRAQTDLVTTTPDALGAAVCSAVQRLAGREASVVRCSVVGQGRRAFAMAMLRDVPGGMFLSGTALADDACDAVLQAVLTALGIEENFLSAAAKRWTDRVDVQAAGVIDAEGVAPSLDDEAGLNPHVRLVQTLPAPGRLAVTTQEAEYRVLRFPAAALVVSTTPNADALQEIDAWMASAEAMGP